MEKHEMTARSETIWAIFCLYTFIMSYGYRNAFVDFSRLNALESCCMFAHLILHELNERGLFWV